MGRGIHSVSASVHASIAAITNKLMIVLVLFGFFFSCFVCRATAEAYGGCQVSGSIGATPASIHHSHSNAGYEPCL